MKTRSSKPDLQPIPLSFRAMFHQYFQMASRIRKHYLSPRVLLCLLTGRFVPPIDRRNLYSLQYSMLPARRAGIMDMWNALSFLLLDPGSSSSSSGSGTAAARALRMGFASFGIPSAATPPVTATTNSASKRMNGRRYVSGPNGLGGIGSTGKG